LLHRRPNTSRPCLIGAIRVARCALRSVVERGGAWWSVVERGLVCACDLERRSVEWSSMSAESVTRSRTKPLLLCIEEPHC
jgi:hypothetical protein